MSKMSKELKAGDKITCFIEQRLQNCLVVRFQNGKAGSENNTSIFRGVLIDEESATTKRIVNSSNVDSKPRLTKELTTTFIQNFNSKSVSGKALRNKKKPSCLVLDDFCIDYHHTSIDAKPERKKQYLKPRGKVVQGNEQVEFKEIEIGGMHSEKIILSGDSDNVTGQCDTKGMSCEDSTKVGKLNDMQNFDKDKVIVQENSPSPEESTKLQGENRYSKRKRSSKPKRFFGSEFDLQPNCEKKSPTKSIADENKKKEFNLFRSSCKINAKSEQKEELTNLKVRIKASDKRQKCKEVSIVHNNAVSLKRSARIQLRKSKNTDNKLEKISDVRYPESKLTGIKRKKLEISKDMYSANHNLQTKTTILGHDEDEKLQNVSPKSSNIKKVTEKTIKKSTKSPKRSNENTSNQRPSSKCKRKHTAVSKHEKLHKGISFMADSEYCNQDGIDEKDLMCFESVHGSFLDEYDNREDSGKKLVVLRQAEKVLRGKITLLLPDEVAEFESSCEGKRKKAMNSKEPILVKGTSFQVSQIGRDKKYILFDFEERSGKKSVQIKVNPPTYSKGHVDGHEIQKQHETPAANRKSTVSCELKNKNKSKDVLAPSKIIIDRSKGIVSIQPPARDVQKGMLRKDGDQLLEGVVSDSDIQKHNKCEPSGAFIVVNKGETVANQSRIDTQSCKDGKGRTESGKCQQETYLSKADDSIALSSERSVKQQGGFTYQAISSDQQQTMQAVDDADDKCSTAESSMKSIYAELSFTRLLASVQEETEKAQRRRTNDDSAEKASNHNDIVGSDCKISDRIDGHDVGVHSVAGSGIKVEGSLTRISSKRPRKDDLLLQVLQKAYETRKNEIYAHQKLDQNNVESINENALQKPELQADSSAENEPLLQGNNPAQDGKLTHLVGVNCSLETVEGGSDLEEKPGGMPSTELKTRKMLLEELIASEADAKTSNEKTLQSRIVKTDILNTQNCMSYVQTAGNSTCRNSRDSKCDLGTMRRKTVNLFRAKTPRYQRPSIDVISGLRNMEQEMLDKNKNHQENLGQCSLRGSLDSMVTKGNCSPPEFGVLWDSDRSGEDVELSDQIISNRTVANRDSLVLGENPKNGQSCEIQESHNSALPKGVGGKDPRTGKGRRKGLWPKKHSLILRGNSEIYLRNENVKETLLQFDGKRSKPRDDCNTGVFLSGVDGEVKTRKTLDEPRVRSFPNCDTRKTILSAGSLRKSYRHAKIGVRKYPIPNRSCRKRNPVNCLKLLGHVLQGKDDTDLRTCDLLSLRKPNAAREQGEELLKQMLKLNKGILIRQDVQQ